MDKKKQPSKRKIVEAGAGTSGSKPLEEALRESEERHRVLLQTAMDGFWMIDMQGCLKEVNEAYCQMSGYSKQELMAMRVSDLEVVEDADETAAHIQRVMEHGEDRFETRHRRKDGGTIDIEISVQYREYGESIRMVAFLRDITERKRAEEALTQSRDLITNLARLVPCVIYQYQLYPDGRSAFPYSSPGMYDIYEVTPEEVREDATAVFGRLHPDDYDRVADTIQESARTLQIFYCEFRVILPRQGLRWRWSQAHPERMVDGGTLWHGIISDITDQKRAQEELRVSEEKYRLVVENAMEAIFIIGDGIFKFANSNASIITGYSQEELTTRSFVEFIHPDDRQIVTERYLQRLKGMDMSNKNTFRIITKAGNIKWVQVNATVINWEDKPASLYFVTDITDRKRLDEEQQRMAKLESVGVLAGGIAHDFNNILTSIVGNISLARMDAAPGSDLQNSLEMAEKASQRATALTKQLLTFSKGGAPVKNLASLTELIKDTAGFALSGSKVKCHFSIPADLWHAEIDAGQISQVIHNMVINAQQAMPTGGSIEIIADNATLSKTQNLGKGLPLKEGDYVRIAVADHGTGIPKDHLEKIFDPFFTTKQKGNGLGLATSFSIAHQHGGHICVESELGAGSTFYLYLPASTETSAPQLDKKEAMKPVGKARILVMDDEQSIKEVAGHMLKHIGYKDVEFAVDGDEAIKKCKAAMESDKPFTVVIMDLTVPGGMGGEATIRELLKIDPGVKAIVSSGYVDDPVMARYREYGFSAVVAKPYTLEHLRKGLQDVIG
jgi:PAS domain S-box-containing protein